MIEIKSYALVPQKPQTEEMLTKEAWSIETHFRTFWRNYMQAAIWNLVVKINMSSGQYNTQLSFNTLTSQQQYNYLARQCQISRAQPLLTRASVTTALHWFSHGYDSFSPLSATCINGYRNRHRFWHQSLIISPSQWATVLTVDSQPILTLLIQETET